MVLQVVTDLILGIESSCDECAAAVVAGGRHVLSSVVHSQVEEHAAYCGVVPEIASRSHLRTVLPVIDAALGKAGVGLSDLGGIAVTTRPGLIGSLLVGVSTAKGLAASTGLPLLAVHHIEAHVYSAMMESGLPEFPCLALVVSGGHTALYRVSSPLEMTKLASTVDDAAGECFDKVASVLGLPYPGGPAIARLAHEGDPDALRLPRHKPKDGLPGFSFSGLKTAVLYHVRGQNAASPTPRPEAIADRADIAASVQEAIVDVLVAQTLAAARQLASNTVLICGGVACNSRLRERMLAATLASNIRSIFPSPPYCTDNAAMVAGLGWHLRQAGRYADLALDASPR
jgi:N6-L-threonylcarbamoyladenine synthase